MQLIHHCLSALQQNKYGISMPGLFLWINLCECSCTFKSRLTPPRYVGTPAPMEQGRGHVRAKVVLIPDHKILPNRLVPLKHATRLIGPEQIEGIIFDDF